MANIIKHIDFENEALRENVCADGTFDNETCDGRELNPGHAIEAAWFLREYAMKYGDPEAMVNNMNYDQLTRKIYEWSFKTGWDDKNGGLWYYKDVLNKPMTTLEVNLKLWWPINEAMICSLLFLKDSVNNDDKEQIMKDWNVASKIWEYGLNSFSNGANEGGWYGYLKEDSKLDLKIIGGSYKGFFHVPRALMFSVNILDEIIARINPKNTNKNQLIVSKL